MFKIGDRVLWNDVDNAVIVERIPESASYKIYCEGEIHQVYSESLTIQTCFLQTVDELEYEEVCKLLFYGNEEMKRASLTAMIIDRMHETDTCQLLRVFNEMYFIVCSDTCDDSDAFRAALIEKYRTTLERAMKDD